MSKSFALTAVVVLLQVSLFARPSFAFDVTSGVMALGSVEETPQNYVAASGVVISTAPTATSAVTSDASESSGATERRIFSEASPEAAKAILNLHQGVAIEKNVNWGLLFTAAGLCGKRKGIKEFKSEIAALACVISANAELNR